VDKDVNGDADLDAGEFSSWLGRMREALEGRGVSDVPCDGCTACCTSSQFVHIDPDEVDTLRHIPSELLFPAPGLPSGHVLLGYDERGHCPMLGDTGCSIYAHRPRACRVYDCRVFTATGVEIDEPAKAAVGRRVRRWRFSYEAPGAQQQHEAARAAAAYLEAHQAELPVDARPLGATQRAVLAIELVDLFTAVDPTAGVFDDRVEPAAADVAAAVARRRAPSPAATRAREPHRGNRRTED
jgi:Fe-S-cluster containining protein